MNRRPDGAVLTTADLCTIALEAGLLTPEELQALKAAKDKGFHSALLDRTREVRFKLFWERKLELNTRRDTDA